MPRARTALDMHNEMCWCIALFGLTRQHLPWAPSIAQADQQRSETTAIFRDVTGTVVG
ncbi:hypothetical protein HNP40_003300 [Mycobacteroides chelonae]|nr:hypothetical protein [Mycobacteroides chelonae]